MEVVVIELISTRVKIRTPIQLNIATLVVRPISAGV